LLKSDLLYYCYVKTNICTIARLLNNYRPKHPQIPPNRIRKPDPIAFLKKKDFSHSLKGIMGGLVIVAIAVINLSLFFGLAEHSETEVKFCIRGLQ